MIEGKVPTKPSEVLQVLIDKTLDPKDAPVYQQYAKVMAWADKYRRLKIRTNADQPDQARNAIAFGAEGIGLCRTEHMFFGEGKIGPMREMILADTVEDRKTALAKLLPLQREDFEGIFEAMNGRPVTIRTIDPPLHEFVPHEEKAQRELAAQMGISYEKVHQRVEGLHEFNPMLGFRGCRLGIIFPEITEMQSRAIFEAAANVQARGIKVEPEVMIPLVGNVKELAHQEKIVRQRCGRGDEGERGEVHVSGRHDDRDSARCDHGRRDRQRGRILQLRDERPDADDARCEPRRCGTVPHSVRREGDLPEGSVRSARSRWASAR